MQPLYCQRTEKQVTGLIHSFKTVMWLRKGSTCGLGDSLDVQSPGCRAVFAFTTPFLMCQPITDTLNTHTCTPQASLAFKWQDIFRDNCLILIINTESDSWRIVLVRCRTMFIGRTDKSIVNPKLSLNLCSQDALEREAFHETTNRIKPIVKIDRLFGLTTDELLLWFGYKAHYRFVLFFFVFFLECNT